MPFEPLESRQRRARRAEPSGRRGRDGNAASPAEKVADGKARKAPGRATCRQDVVRAGEVVAEGGGGIAPDEDRPRGGREARAVALGGAPHQLHVLGGEGNTLVRRGRKGREDESQAVRVERGARVAAVPLAGDDFRLDEEAFLARAAEGERTVPLLCSPNNPTGGTVSREFVRRLCAVSPVVLLDQAYVDFSEEKDDLLPLLDELRNLVLFRTLSKAYSIAGLRVGYAAAWPDVAEEIAKAILPFSVDVGAEEIALAVLARRGEVRERCRAVARERERVAAALRALGARVAPSRANFLFLVPPDGDGARVLRDLRARGVLVRDQTTVVPGALRVTIGTPDENDLFLSTLKEVL